MTRHRDDLGVQKLGCAALGMLARKAENKVRHAAERLSPLPFTDVVARRMLCWLLAVARLWRGPWT
eukprot:255066-Hanusia_phi.AAC.1